VTDKQDAQMDPGQALAILVGLAAVAAIGLVLVEAPIAVAGLVRGEPVLLCPAS
jgi:hypothetical protein